MQEVLPDVWHWTAEHPRLGGTRVSSYWLEDSGVLIDPLIPEDVGIEWFGQRAFAPAVVVLSNRHHYRASADFIKRFGIEVLAPAAGMHEFTAGQRVSPYEPGDRLPGGLRAVAVGALAPDDGGLFLEDREALWLADALVRKPEDANAAIGWVLDQLMDEPLRTKEKLLEALTRLLDEYSFSHLLLAHGLPLIGNGRDCLEDFVNLGGWTATKAF